MSFSYDRYDRQQRRGGGTQRSALGYWIPLVLTVTVATVGIAAWVWSERQDGDDQDREFDPERRRKKRVRDDNRPSTGPSSSFPSQPGLGQTPHANVQSMPGEWHDEDEMEAETIMARMSGAIRRTPSPQQMFDTASKRVVAGVAAAGAAVGRGLSAITEEGKGDDFVDHERWSEEAKNLAKSGASAGYSTTNTAASTSRQAAQPERPARDPRKVTKTVAIVVSSESNESFEQEQSYHIEHASILSHFTSQINLETTNVLILIYAPHLKTTSEPRERVRASSDASSYSNISTPGPDPASAEDEVIQQYASEPQSLYASLHRQALSMVDHPTCVLPFTTFNGHVHLLKSLHPNIVYIQEGLCGTQGELVPHIGTAVGQIVVVLGTSSVGSHLVDTETEDEGNGRDGKRAQAKWWMDEKRVGLGKGVELVEGVRLGEDWSKRVRT